MKKYLKALWFTLAINASIALGDLVLTPLHAAGRAQSVLGYVLGITHLLNMPGFTFSGMAGLRPHDAWTWRGFVIGGIVNLIFWGVAAIAYLRLRRRFDLAFPESAPEPTPTRPGISRRTLLVGSGRAVAASGAGLGAWAFLAESRWFEVTRRQIPIANLPPSLDGLRIVQLTDIHHCRWTSIQWLRRIVQTTNALAPDLVALTGDYVYRGKQYVQPAALELGKLRARIGVVGVLGNHDWWQDAQLTRWAFDQARIPLLDNTRRFITPDRKLVTSSPKTGLCLAGVGDFWEDVCLYDDALGGVPGGMPRLLLSHNPDVAEETDFLASGHRVDLMLSGHTHGGQVRLPGIGTPVTNSIYGQKYASGLVEGPACPVYVSRGLGMTAMPIRFACRPEIAVLELRCREASL